jgi:hypothetical protein
MPDDGADAVSISDRVVETLEDYDADTFSTTVASTTVVEGEAATFRVQNAGEVSNDVREDRLQKRQTRIRMYLPSRRVELTQA